MNECLGFVETRGLVAAIEAADCMSKAANINIIEVRQVGSGLIAVIISGEVSAVTAAVEVGAKAAERVGEVISVNIIPRPNEEIGKVLPI